MRRLAGSIKPSRGAWFPSNQWPMSLLGLFPEVQVVLKNIDACLGLVIDIALPGLCAQALTTLDCVWIFTFLGLLFEVCSWLTRFLRFYLREVFQSRVMKGFLLGNQSSCCHSSDSQHHPPSLSLKATSFEKPPPTCLG